MPQASSRLPKLITLVWGRDRLEVDDPLWIAKIMQEMELNSEHAERVGRELSWPRSRMRERMDSNLTAMGFHSSHEESDAQMGYQPPNQQGPVAIEALKAFLGLQLPVALNFTSYTGRSEHRMSAVHTAFGLCRHFRMHNEIELEWMFSGYQLYASHHIGSAHLRPYGTGGMGHLERRLLNGQWVRWGFDGASTPPPGRHWSSNRRMFILEPSGIQRVNQSDADLEPEYGDREFEDVIEEGLSPSPEAT